MPLRELCPHRSGDLSECPKFHAHARLLENPDFPAQTEKKPEKTKGRRGEAPLYLSAVVWVESSGPAATYGLLERPPALVSTGEQVVQCLVALGD